MKATIRTIYSSDVDVDSYVSVQPDNDAVWVRLLVGPSHDEGEESFDVLICTPLWLREKIAAEGPQIGRHSLIVEPFDLHLAIDFLKKQVENIDAPTWKDLAEKLSRIGYWEFEDYVDYRP